MMQQGLPAVLHEVCPHVAAYIAAQCLPVLLDVVACRNRTPQCGGAMITQVVDADLDAAASGDLRQLQCRLAHADATP